MRTETHCSPTIGWDTPSRRRRTGPARALIANLAGALAIAACSTQPLTDETGKLIIDSQGADCGNKVIGRIHSTIEWKRIYLPGDYFHGNLADDWYLCDQQVVEHKDGLLSLICIWCSTENTRWKLVQEGCAGQWYRFVPRLMAPMAREEGPPKVACLAFIDVDSDAGTLDVDVSGGPTALGQLAAFDAGLLGADDVDLDALSASLRLTIPANVGGVVVSGEAFEIDVAVHGASREDRVNQVLTIGRGSTVTASGPLLQVAGWAWYAGFSEVEASVGTTAVHVQFHGTLPLAWMSTKEPGGEWKTVAGSNGQPASWWLDPCVLGTRGCEDSRSHELGVTR